MKRLLVLRPQPGAAQTIARAQALGLSADSYPLFTVRSLPWTPPPPDDYDALLVTSANAIRHGGPAVALYHDLPAYAVGQATAQTLRDAGFAQVIAGTSDVASVSAMMVADNRRVVLHLAGVDRRSFHDAALRIDPVTVYASEPTGDPAGLAAVITAGMVLLVHSPRAARRLADLVPRKDRKSLHVIAISTAAAAEAGTGWTSLAVATATDDNAMLALAVRLCE